jgi:hypothetical protein
MQKFGDMSSVGIGCISVEQLITDGYDFSNHLPSVLNLVHIQI